MNLGFFRIEKQGYSLLGGILFVVLLSAFLRPRQLDNAHTIGLLSVSGGRAIHAGHFYLGQDLMGSYTLLLTAQVLPPVSGDIRVQLQGPQAVNYEVSSRNPPGIPLKNRTHNWYQYLDPVLKSVQPLDDLVIYVRIQAPAQPGEYELQLVDARNPVRTYLRLPVTFSEFQPDSAGQNPLENWPCH